MAGGARTPLNMTSPGQFRRSYTPKYDPRGAVQALEQKTLNLPFKIVKNFRCAADSTTTGKLTKGKARTVENLTRKFDPQKKSFKNSETRITSKI